MKDKFKDITLKNYLRITIPTILSMMFISVYTMTDGIFISRKLGDTALAALNITMPGFSMVFGFFFMLIIGGSAIIGIQQGANEHDKADESFSNLIYSLVLTSLLFLITGYLFTDKIINILGAKGSMAPYAKDYLGIMYMGAFAFGTKFFTEIFLRLEGRFNLSLIGTLVGGIVNIILDYVFIYHLDLGMKGAAIATLIGAFSNGLFGIVYFSLHKSSLKLKLTSINWRYHLDAITNGSSEMVTSLSGAVTTYIFNMVLLKTIGQIGVSSISIVIYINMLLSSVFMGMSMGIQPLLSYNFGAERLDNIKKLLTISAKIISCIGVISYIVANVFKYQLISLFKVGNPEVIQLTATAFTIVSFGFLINGFNILSSGFFTAIGNGKYSGILSFSRSIIFKSALVLILPLYLGIDGVWMTLPLSELLCIFMTLYFINRVRRELKGV